MSRPTGLTAAQVSERLNRGQVNVVENKISRTIPEILRTNIFTRFNALIISLAIVVFILSGSIFDCLFGLVTIVNSAIGIFQELHAKRLLDKITILVNPKITAIRDSQPQQISIEQIVLGDTLVLKTGDQVPVDGTVLESDNLEIDEALLTGESDPIVKRADQPVLSGSIVVSGEGIIKVTKVGAQTYSNKLTAQAKVFKRVHSELIFGTNFLLKHISWALVFVGPLIVWGQLRIDYADWRSAIVHSTAVINGMIPDGLVLLTSVAFLLAVVTLIRKKVLVQQLPAVEVLARVDTLLLDKTGTLTDGNISFHDLQILDPKHDAKTKQALAALAKLSSSPTNSAILSGLKSVSPLKVIDSILFNSTRKWSAISVSSREHYILGAPEILLAADSDTKSQAAAIAATGHRVLVLVSTKTAPTPVLRSFDLRPDFCPRPLALVVLSENIRKDAKKTLDFFDQQNVHIKIISGDNPLTVESIARQVGIKNAKAFDARNLPTSQQELHKILSEYNIFGRVKPEQKRTIVAALQSLGHTVAMTGDGVNDALALKKADIGIAMESGAAATKSVAELVLLDNKFSHLPTVLGEGRRVIANIERVANLFIVKNIYSLTLGLLVTLFAVRYPFMPSQYSVIGTLTIGIPSFFLALAPNNQIYRPGFLRRVLKFSIPTGLVAAIAMMVNYTLATQTPDITPAAASNATAIVLIITCLAVIGCLARPFKPWKVALIIFCAAAFAAAEVIPFIATHFHFTFDPKTLPTALVCGLIGAIMVEIIYRIALQKPQSKN